MSEQMITSKVLVQETDPKAEDVLRDYLKVNNLIGLRTSDESLLTMLESNTDLGGVFISDSSSIDGESGKALGMKIHKIRPELPIFFREQQAGTLLEEPFVSAFAGFYDLDNMHLLDELLQSHLFINHYPMPLIRAIQEISETAFSALISDVDVVTDAPYLVNDQIIYGELFSLIPLESDWCRGTMMLQTTQQEVMDMIHAGKTPLEKTHADFRDVNELVNEITNLIWGKIKSEFFTNRDHSERIITRTQVPTLVNHQEKYISFGTNNPQLSFRYTISDKTNQSPSIVIFQKLVFNLSWRPEDFNQSDTAIDEFVDSGELELF